MVDISSSEGQQDTVVGRFEGRVLTSQDSTRPAYTQKTRLVMDSARHKNFSPRKSIEIIFADSTSVCERNSIADVTFYDSTFVVTNTKTAYTNNFPFQFIEQNKKIESEVRTILLEHLKPGQEIFNEPLHHDWIIGVILLISISFIYIRNSSKNIFANVTKFFLFSGINDVTSRDSGGFFHWQSTVQNFVSFLATGLYAYLAASNFGLFPPGVKGMYFWLISVSIIISGVTLRHIICTLTGMMSGQQDVFRGYLTGVYLSHRFSALFLFILIILISYTALLPIKIYFISGIILIGIMYLIRVLRLLVIFLNRNISIFYLILYLCTLEILPVIVSVKYLTGLI